LVPEDYQEEEEAFIIQQDWSANGADACVVGVPQQEFDVELPQYFMDDAQAIQTYDDLVESPFVNEICSELDQWNEKAEVQKSMSATTAQEPHEMTNFDDIDLFDFCSY
jgi:hypothetical protein